MDTYSLEEIAASIGKNPDVVKLWFNRLEENYDFYVHEENGDKLYSQRDLSIARFISKKLNDKWSYDAIFEQLTKMYFLETNKELHDRNKSTVNYLLNIGRDPENLFYEIAQDNEVIRVFKYHSLRVMFLASPLAKKAGGIVEDLFLLAFYIDFGTVAFRKKIL